MLVSYLEFLRENKTLIFSDDDESDEETSSEYPKPNSEILPVDLEPDISLILKLMPDKAYDEVRFMLEAHQNDPSRVQVCT